MSTIAVNAITDASGGNTATINGYTPTMSNMAGRNKIINGSMVFDQRNAGASVSPMAGGYGVDRWKGSYLGGGAGRFSAQQSSTAPSGFVNSWLITVTTADASPASGYGYEVQQSIEGTNFYDLAWGTASASAATLSFWVRSSVTGTFPITLNNSVSDRVFGATYTINSANTWEYKTVAISGDTTGTWLTTTGIGVNVNFCFGGGSSRTISTGWQAGSGSTPTNVTGCTQLIATSGATFYITGVQLEAGSVATPFERRQYGTELALCQRYYAKLNNDGVGGDTTLAIGMQQSSTRAIFQLHYPVLMRVEPSVGISALDVSDLTGWGTSCTLAGGNMGYVSGMIVCDHSSNGAAYRPVFLRIQTNSSGFVSLSAEL